MANQNIATLGRFSSQMLTYLGTQRTVKIINGQPQNTFTYNTSSVTYTDPGAANQADLGGGVVGNYAPNTYNSVTSYFLSRGVGPAYADTMAGLAIDMASMTGVDPIAMLEQSEFSGRLLFTDNTYRAMNNLRDPGNQLATVTSVDNIFSIQAYQIRA